MLAALAERTGCRVLLAQKAFSNYDFYPLLSRYLAGTEASGLYEARLGKEEMPQGEVHVFCGAYREDEFQELLQYADHIVFNSIHQLKAFGPRGKQAGKSLGLRVNPECSTQEGHAIYDPCAPGSRLGTTLANFDESLLPLLDGLHFHTLCEQNSDDLETTANTFEEKFGKYLPQMKWLNLGGGHHITRADYDIPRLVRGGEVFPGEVRPGGLPGAREAVVLNAGFLVSSVLEIVHNGMDIAILDTSAACHMPDVLEMPYRPPVKDSGKPGGEALHLPPGRSHLPGRGCYSGITPSTSPLAEGSQIVLEDMALYTMVKTNTFNGMPLPTIALRHEDGAVEV